MILAACRFFFFFLFFSFTMPLRQADHLWTHPTCSSGFSTERLFSPVKTRRGPSWKYNIIWDDRWELTISRVKRLWFFLWKWKGFAGIYLSGFKALKRWYDQKYFLLKRWIWKLHICKSARPIGSVNQNKQISNGGRLDACLRQWCKSICLSLMSRMKWLTTIGVTPKRISHD